MAQFVQLDSCDKLENGRPRKMLLNLDMVVRIVERTDDFCHAVIISDGDSYSQGLSAPWLSLPYGLEELRQIIAQATAN